MSRVLIVEDEAHLAQGLRFNLQAEGHEVDVAGDGETALEMLSPAAGQFDAVVLDVMLPGRSGFEVATQLREEKNYIPILMLTARGRPEEVALACRREHLKRNWLPAAAIFRGHLDVGNSSHRGPKSRPVVLVPESHARPVFPRREREPGCCLFAKL